MRDLDAAAIAAAAGAMVARAQGSGSGPARVTIDSRAVGADDLFVGLPGSRVDGGSFAPAVLAAGAWGVLVGPQYADAATSTPGGAVLVADDPLRAIQRLARAWRHQLGAAVVGITGSTGKTTTKDLLAAMVAPHRRTVATAQNLNTEIGLPLTILGAPAGTEVLILEMGMRGRGQIAELVAIADPDVGLIVNVGPVHLELLGSIQAIAQTKAEIVTALRPGATAIVPADEPLLAPYVQRDDITVVTFGPGGDVADLGGVQVSLAGAHLQPNALAALAAAHAIGVRPSGHVEVALSAHRGQAQTTANGVTVIDDCYNANPMSMRATIDHLAVSAPDGGRTVAVLGDMLELGPDERRFHAEVGAHARDRQVAVLVAVGERAAAMVAPFGGDAYAVPDAAAAATLVPTLVKPGDTVLVKASRGVGLEAVVDALHAESATSTGEGVTPHHG